MYSKIMIPVDLAHESTLEKAIRVGADLANLYEASVCLVGVSTSPPSSVAHNEREYGEKLAQFTKQQSEQYGVLFDHQVVHSNDPAAELERALTKACEDMNCDLVIMASHVPGFVDHFIDSNASELVTHTSISVFIVR